MGTKLDLKTNQNESNHMLTSVTHVHKGLWVTDTLEYNNKQLHYYFSDVVLVNLLTNCVSVSR